MVSARLHLGNLHGVHMHDRTAAKFTFVLQTLRVLMEVRYPYYPELEKEQPRQQEQQQSLRARRRSAAVERERAKLF